MFALGGGREGSPPVDVFAAWLSSLPPFYPAARRFPQHLPEPTVRREEEAATER